jgi:NitT/TauT family transport system permease protein
VGATIGEWIGGDAGLGYYIQMASGDMKMDVAFAIIVMLAFLGLFLYYLVVVFEKILVPWHVSQRSSVSGLVTTK